MCAGWLLSASLPTHMLVGTGLLLLILAGLSGWAVADRVLRPIDKIVDATREVSGPSPGTQIDAKGGSRELDELITMINAMLERLQQGFERSQRFTADASHELKTPLTILYGRLNRALQQADNESYQRLFAGLLSEVERLTAIVEKLLLLSQADSGGLALKRESVDLSEFISLLAEDIGHMDSAVVIRTNVESGITVEGDRSLLRQVFYNLASNAVRYSRRERIVEMALRKAGNQALFIISNPADSISPENRELIFERFYSFERSHNRGTAGAGLGLSLAKEIILAHRGDIELDTCREGFVVFRVKLPLSIETELDA